MCETVPAVVTGESVLAHKPTEAAAKCESRDANSGKVDPGICQTEDLCLVIEFTPRDTSLSAGRAPQRIDTNALHPRQVNDDAPVANGVTSDVVTATTHGHQELVGASKIDGVDDVGHSSALDDHCGVFVDHPVPNLADLVAVVIAGTEQLPTQARLELLDRRFLDHSTYGGRDLPVWHDLPPFVCSGSAHRLTYSSPNQGPQ